jgi:hypothetical protein
VHSTATTCKKKQKRSKKEVDEFKKSVHNLVSLLLTNKTICQRVAKKEAKAEIWRGKRKIFKN